MQSETVLVVDDDPGALEFCCTILSKAGYRVLRAASGPQALEICRCGERIDLALVDVVMPGMNGIEVVQQITIAGNGVKVALISGYTREEVERLIGTEGSSYRIFWKPF